MPRTPSVKSYAKKILRITSNALQKTAMTAPCPQKADKGKAWRSSFPVLWALSAPGRTWLKSSGRPLPRSQWRLPPPRSAARPAPQARACSLWTLSPTQNCAKSECLLTRAAEVYGSCRSRPRSNGVCRRRSFVEAFLGQWHLPVPPSIVPPCFTVFPLKTPLPSFGGVVS